MPSSTPIMEPISCIFCGRDPPSSVLIRENGFDGRQCHACGLIFVSPRPSLEAIVNLYGHDEAHVPAASHLAAGFSKRLYAKNSLRILRKHKATGKLLEIGAGAGFFLDEARKQGFVPHAIEFNRLQARHIREVLDIPCQSKPLADAAFAGESFGAVYHCDVISHFYDPISEFRAINAALRDDGLVVFETGNLGDVDPRYLKQISRFQYPDHLFFFSRKNIAQLLEETGFELLEICSYSILVDIWITRLRVHLRNAAREVLQRLQKTQTTQSIATQLADSCGTAASRPATNRTGPVAWLKTADQYVNYLVRYRLGRFLPKGRHPQTLIVVARKRAAG